MVLFTVLPVVAAASDRGVEARRTDKPIPCRLDALTLDARSGARVVTRCEGRLGDADLVSVVEAALEGVAARRQAGAPRTLPPAGPRVVPFPIATEPSARVAHDGAMVFGRPALIRPVIPADLPPFDGETLPQMPDPLADAIPVPRPNPWRAIPVNALRGALETADGPLPMAEAVDAVWGFLGPYGAHALAAGYWSSRDPAHVRAALALYDALWRRTQDGIAAARLAEAAATGRGMKRDQALARRYLAGAALNGAMQEAERVSAMLTPSIPPS